MHEFGHGLYENQVDQALERSPLARGVSLGMHESQSRMWEYLGIEVPSDTEGVLQDVHWSGGSIGYFPTYALGNLISAQIWERITSELPDLPDAIEAGDFAPLRDWLRENLHRHGRKFTPAETLERVVGTQQIDPEPYVRYLREKLAGIYGIAA
jgi:carboxypeptidase Taq